MYSNENINVCEFLHASIAIKMVIKMYCHKNGMKNTDI